jgi:AcrR family transcriptional regulator
MKNKDATSEQAILDAAEQVFLAKGFAAARTTEIAKLAGVNHGMLHYYHNSKEELFNKVFDKKLQLLNNSFAFAMEQDIPFLEKVKLAIESHFDFSTANPKLVPFIFDEITVNTAKKQLFNDLFFPKIKIIVDKLVETLLFEMGKGTIKSVSASDFLMNIFSLNIASNAAALLLDQKEEFLKKRKAEIVELILSSIKP